MRAANESLCLPSLQLEVRCRSYVTSLEPVIATASSLVAGHMDMRVNLMVSRLLQTQRRDTPRRNHLLLCVCVCDSCWRTMRPWRSSRRG